MTNREYIQQQLSAYIDGELDASDVAAVEQALAREPELARELQQLKATRELLRRLPLEHAPDDFASRVLAQTERRHLVHLHTPAGQSINWLRYFVVAAVALIAISVALVTVVGIYSAGKADRTMIAAKPPAQPLDSGEESGLFDKAAKSETGKDGEFKGGAEHADRMAEAGQAADNNVLICTDDLPKAKRELERELGKNAIQFKSHGSGDEEAVVVADVDSSQMSRLNSVISNMRSSNKGAELSGRQLRRGRSDEQVAVAQLKRKSSGDESRATHGGGAGSLAVAAEGQKLREAASKELSKPTGGQAGAGKPAEKAPIGASPIATACKASDSGRLAKSLPAHLSPAKPGAEITGGTIAAATCPASDDSAKLVLADKVHGEHSTQALPASSPAAPAPAAQTVMATSQSRFGNTKNQSNQLALRVQITLQYHPSLTQGSGAGQDQSGGRTGENVDQSSESCPADNTTSQPNNSQQNPNR